MLSKQSLQLQSTWWINSSQPAHWPCSHHLVNWRLQAWRHTAIHGYLVLSHTSTIAIFSRHGGVVLTTCILLFVSTSEYPLNVLYLFDKNGIPWNTVISPFHDQQHRFGCTCSRHTKQKTFDLKICPKFRHPCVTCVYVYMDKCNDMLLMRVRCDAVSSGDSAPRYWRNRR